MRHLVTKMLKAKNLPPQDFQKIIFLALQSLNTQVYGGTFLTASEIFFGPMYYQSQIFSLYSDPPKNGEKHYTLKELSNLTASDILKQHNSILTIFERRKNFLIKKHLLHKGFQGNIFFEKGELVKKLNKSVKNLEYPSNEIYVVQKVMKPFCRECQFTPNRCQGCIKVPPMHLLLKDVLSGKSHTSPVNLLWRIHPSEVKDIDLSLDCLNQLDRGIFKIPQTPEPNLWNYGEELIDMENNIDPCMNKNKMAEKSHQTKQMPDKENKKIIDCHIKPKRKLVGKSTTCFEFWYFTIWKGG